MRIVQATPTRGKSLYHIILDSGAELHVASSVYYSFGLFPDRQLNEEELAAVQRQSDYALAKERAIHWLSYGDHSCGECRARLIKAFPSEIVEKVIAELSRLQLLDDNRVMQSAINQSQQRGWGKKKVAFELRKKGFDSSQIAEACTQLGTEDELSSAVIWLTRQAQNKDINDQVVQRRLFGALMRRGFGVGIAQQALRQVVGNFADTELT